MKNGCNLQKSRLELEQHFVRIFVVFLSRTMYEINSKENWRSSYCISRDIEYAQT